MSESGGVDREREIPAGWAWSTLQDLLACEPRAITDGPFGSNLKSAHYTDSGARVIRLQNVGDGEFRDERAYISLEHFETLRAHEAIAGDLLLASLGEKLPRVAILPKLDEPSIVKADVIRARVHPEILTKWVYYALLAPQTHAYAGALIKGVGRPRLGMAAMKAIPVPVPPLAEQHRIVEALEEQLSRLEVAEANVRKVMRRVDALLRRVTDFTSNVSIGADDPTAPVPETAGSIDGALSLLPADWRWMRLGELADVVGGVTKDKKKQSDPDVPEVPYLRVANVQRGHLVLENVASIRVSAEKAEQLKLQAGDVLMNEGGDRDKLGRGWVWCGQIPNAIHQNHVFRARIRDDMLIPELLSWYANGAAKWFEENGKQSTNLASISLSKIKNLPVPVPPQAEQRRIAEQIEERLIQLRHARSVTERVLRQGAKLRNALLRKAFQGELVPQNEADEPAAKVLIRIAAERGAQPKRTRRAKSPAQRSTPAPEPTVAPTLAVQQEFDL
ncbi:restriction endonuclease subunit S [Streptomyces luteogriseus]|uniref:restriction endonuclease subunit S n=1 Tax=Streptomyces luteogriseus TaxID=68233 RepID=UPI00379D7BB1